MAMVLTEGIELLPTQSASERAADSESESPAEAKPAKRQRSPQPDSDRGATRRVRLKIRRQDAPDKPETRRWELFEVDCHPGMTVIGALQQIQKNPVTAAGVEVAPVAWDCGCLEEACGSCTMLINGRVRQACSARLDEVAPKRRTVVLKPLSKFPLVRDLMVDRSRLFEAKKRIRAWLEIDGTQPCGPAPPQSQSNQQLRYALSRCISCGCCLEACPQYGEHSDFVGAAALNQVRLAATHPAGALQKSERIEAIRAPGGIIDCGKAQNCVEVCPTGIPLVDSIQQLGREATRRMLFDWLLG